MFSVEELQEKVNAEIITRSTALADQKPQELYLPVKYSLDMGGKRLRPVLLLLGYNLFSNTIENAIPAAVAIEVFHNFTLLHDDIMDHANVRRNKPTVHVQFSENNAILSGDVMAFLSYQFLMECQSDILFDVAKLFTRTAIEVCEGQQLDMDFEERLDVSADEYLEMIKLKTAVLLACGLKAGALLANAKDEISEKLYAFGLNLGLAFQLQDDLLDTFGNQETFGKKIGGDILANKNTFLLITALERADFGQRQNLNSWIERKDFDEYEKIREVTAIFKQLQIHEITQKKIDQYFHNATQILNDLPVEKQNKTALANLSKKMLKRDH